jgi:protein involved in polysaccharide export with SLBB domain/capsular polysaccharide biosynthesis protein
MIDEEEQSITVLRKRRRNGANGSHSANGSTNGHTRNGANHHNESWGWTRGGKNPFARDNEESQRERGRDGGSEREFRRNPTEPRRLIFDMPSQAQPPADAIKFPFDPWRLLSAVRRRWYWLVVGALSLAALAFFAGDRLVRYKVSISLVRRQLDSAINTNEQDPNRPRMLADQTLYAFMRSGEVLRRVAAHAATLNPPVKISAEELSKSVGITPSANPDILILSVSGRRNSPALATLANIFAEEVVRYTRDIQAAESGDVATYLAQKVKIADKELDDARQELLQFQKDAGFVLNLDREAENYLKQISDYDTQLEKARIEYESDKLMAKGVQREMVKIDPKKDKIKEEEEKLASMLVEMREAHPDVILQKRKIEALKKAQTDPDGTPGLQMSSSAFGNSLQVQTLEYEAKAGAAQQQIAEYTKKISEVRGKLNGISDKSIKYADLKAKIASREATRQLLEQKQKASQLFVENAMGFYRVVGQASARDIDWKRRAMKIAAMTIVGASVGLFTAMFLACFVEVSDTRLKTVADIERATRLPVLATLGDLTKMSPSDQINWAFRTLTILRGKLCAHPDDALVCGFISSRPGEGRSTWVNLLVSAASQRGLRVLTVDTRPTAEGPKTEPRPPHYPAGAPTNPKQEKTPYRSPEQNAEETAAANDLLAKPMAIAERLKDPESIVHIPIPGWVWSLERRQQWQEALSAWREIDNTVILIELPPASHPEAILLAEKIPQLIWLVGSGMADVKETREQLETLRHAHCNIVGAALNQEPPPPMNTRVGRWFNWAVGMIALGFGLCGSVQAQTQTNQETKLAFSATAQPKRAAWQQRLTLGPGDAMDISIFGKPTLTRTNIFVGPDGRISYLQAQGIKAQGLTIEELRDRLDQEMDKLYPGARTMIFPTAFVSKKYFLLGKVVNKGAYPLDRPLTVIEAVARAQGLETGLYDRHTVETADLSRSFLVRNGKREKIDFEKLFLEGDLSQNAVLEPDDFIYFGTSGAREIYVLGEVMNPGPIGFVSDATIMAAIADRGGFTERAYKSRVLVVRGSLNKPEPHIIDVQAVFNATGTDWRLESRDIIYVSRRPWVRAEELLDDAMQSFIQGFVTAFAGVKVGPFIKNPVFGD